MPSSLFYGGVILFIFGVSAFVGIIPLSGVNTTVTITNMSVSCAPYAGAISTNACTASVTLTNTNATTLQDSIWMTVSNQKLQNLAVVSQKTGLAPNLPTKVTVGLGAIPLGANYTLTAFVTNNLGWVVSQNAQTGFSVGSVTVTIDDPGSATGSVNPVPGIYTYQIGQQVTLTFTPVAGCVFQSWLDMLGGYTSTQNPLTFKPWRNFEFVVQFASTACTSPSYTITTGTLGGGGTISPSSKQSLGGSSSQNSATFTATPATNWYFSHWNLLIPSVGVVGPTQNVTSLLGGSATNPVTITTTMLSSLPLGSALVLQAVLVIGYPFVIAQTPGITTTPPAGTTYYPPGKQVTVTATVASNYCWTGFNLDGINQGSTTTITVTMSGAHTIVPGSTPLPSGKTTCGPPPPPPPPGGGTGLGQIIGLVSMVGGAGLMFLGIRRKR